MKTYMAHANDVVRKWYVVDAEGVALGRVASQVAAVLRGKNKPTFTPNVDTGDFVIVVNCDKVVLTGKKLEKKYYRYHTGHIGGLKAKLLWLPNPTWPFTKRLKVCFPKTV